MRIIAGKAKGRTLYAPSGRETRPTSDKIRGSLFNIIGSRVVEARVLDLFGGTGALALEALSRGADSAVIADSAREAQQVIERNARAVLKEAAEDRVRIIKSDYRAALTALAGSVFDLVFLDPPYRMADAYGAALTRLVEGDMLAPGCLVVLERRRDVQVAVPAPFAVTDTRQYGDTAVDFVELDAAAEQIQAPQRHTNMD